MMSTIPATDDDMATSMEHLFPAYFHRPDLLDLGALAADTQFRAATMVRGFEVLSLWSSVDRLGSLDVFTSYPQAYRIADRVPDSTVVVFEDDGHFPWIKEPDRFWTTLRNWHAQSRR